MADDNTIGLYVELYTKNFEDNKRRLDSMISSLESNLGALEQRQKAAAQAAKAQADAERKAVAEAEKAARAQETAINKSITAVRRFAIASAIATAAVVKGYQLMRDAAKELGDTEAIAQFEAMDAAIGGLKDTLLQAGLEMLKITDAVDIVVNSLAFMQDIVAKSAAGWAGMLTLVQNVFQVAQGIINRTGPVTIDTKAIVNNARIASAQVYAELSGAPQKREQTKIITDAEKEANKQREKTAQSIVDYNSKIRELTIKSGESILEAEKDFHAKSAEAWSSYMEKVSDITAKGITKRAELARDYSDKIAAAETDYQRDIEDANYQHGKKLADIERDYQRTIQNIQQSFQEDSLDAIRNLDAIALIRAKEKRDKDLANAEVSRNDANDAESENYSRQLYEAQRAFEDKRREAEIAYQRGLDDQKRAEAEALQEAKNAYNQQTIDARNGYNEKLRTIQQAYNNENAAAQAQYGYSEAAYRDHLQRMQAITAAYGIGRATSTRGAGTINRRQEGGLDIVSSPTQFLAGEAGPEMVFTAPLNRSVPVMTPQIVEHTGDFQHSIDSTIRSSVAGMDGRIVAAVSKVLREVLG